MLKECNRCGMPKPLTAATALERVSLALCVAALPIMTTALLMDAIEGDARIVKFALKIALILVSCGGFGMVFALLNDWRRDRKDGNDLLP